MLPIEFDAYRTALGAAFTGSEMVPNVGGAFSLALRVPLTAGFSLLRIIGAAESVHGKSTLGQLFAPFATDHLAAEVGAVVMLGRRGALIRLEEHTVSLSGEEVFIKRKRPGSKPGLYQEKKVNLTSRRSLV